MCIALDSASISRLEGKGQINLADLKQSGHIAEKYNRWFTESIDVLARYHYIQYDRETHVIAARPVTLSVDEAWQEWHRIKAEWQSDQGMRSQITLVESILQALPSVLTGEIPATEVLFPDASLHLVEGISSRMRLQIISMKFLPIL